VNYEGKRFVYKQPRTVPAAPAELEPAAEVGVVRSQEENRGRRGEPSAGARRANRPTRTKKPLAASGRFCLRLFEIIAGQSGERPLRQLARLPHRASRANCNGARESLATRDAAYEDALTLLPNWIAQTVSAPPDARRWRT